MAPLTTLSTLRSSCRAINSLWMLFTTSHAFFSDWVVILSISLAIWSLCPFFLHSFQVECTFWSKRRIVLLAYNFIQHWSSTLFRNMTFYLFRLPIASNKSDIICNLWDKSLSRTPITSLSPIYSFLASPNSHVSASSCKLLINSSTLLNALMKSCSFMFYVNFRHKIVV